MCAWLNVKMICNFGQCFSDFPPPPEFPNYMHNTKMIRYLDDYSDKFGMRPYIKLRHEVIRVAPTEDYKETHRWYVKVKNLETGEISEDVFDGVMVCTGESTRSVSGKWRFKRT